ncbi:globin [Gaiella sp.]|uniref:globin n=1 Tax=Gaiella sp. TaxID=2663207 RepID=UPI00326526B4
MIRVSEATPHAVTPFEAFGGHPFFDRLVAAFYRRVETDPVIRPMYPGDDLDPAKERLQLFLEQYWGGPTTYSDDRGHPRLRMRHAAFPIDYAASERWLDHMRAALDEQELPLELDALLREYFEAAAPAMVNAP